MMIRTFFFDLGNVLLSFCSKKMWRQISEVCNADIDEIKEIVSKQKLWKKYEVGKISTEEFVLNLQKCLQKPIDIKEFSYAASNIFTPIPKVIELLQYLKGQNLEIFLISNTCEIHYEFIKRNYTFLNHFDKTILSYEIGAAKPDTLIYEYALKNTQSKPDQCFYIDDIEEFVQSARSIGITSHHFTDSKLLFSELKDLGISL